MHVYIAPEPGNPVLRRCTVIIMFQHSHHNLSQYMLKSGENGLTGEYGLFN